MPAQEPAIDGRRHHAFLKNPEAATAIVFDTVVIACFPIQWFGTPPFGREPFRAFRFDNPAYIVSHSKLDGRSSRVNCRDLNSHRRINPIHGADSIFRPQRARKLWRRDGPELDRHIRAANFHGCEDVSTC